MNVRKQPEEHKKACFRDRHFFFLIFYFWENLPNPSLTKLKFDMPFILCLLRKTRFEIDHDTI